MTTPAGHHFESDRKLEDNFDENLCRKSAYVIFIASNDTLQLVCLCGSKNESSLIKIERKT